MSSAHKPQSEDLQTAVTFGIHLIHNAGDHKVR